MHRTPFYLRISPQSRRVRRGRKGIKPQMNTDEHRYQMNHRRSSVFIIRKLLLFEQGIQRKDAKAQSTPKQTRDVVFGSRRPVGLSEKILQNKKQSIPERVKWPGMLLLCNIFSERSASGAAAAAYPVIPFVFRSPFLHFRSLCVLRGPNLCVLRALPSLAGPFRAALCLSVVPTFLFILSLRSRRLCGESLNL